MSVKNILTLKESEFYKKDTVLRESSKVVTDFDSNLRNTVDDLIDTLNHHRIAVGLSAPQIGVFSRVAVVNVKKREKRDPLVMINPKLLKAGDKLEKRMEACMSLPFFQGEVIRPYKISIDYQDPMGEKHQLHADGFLARVILHELDHLDGVLYVDRMNPEDKLIPAEFFNEK